MHSPEEIMPEQHQNKEGDNASQATRRPPSGRISDEEYRRVTTEGQDNPKEN
jgi:hypothetical protein